MKKNNRINISNKQNLMLIADDIELNRFLLRDIFSEEYDIIEAVDGEEALELIRKHKKELTVILLDFMMPKKDGFEVLEELQKQEDTAAIPVIMITAVDGAENRALRTGVWDYLQKPYDMEIAKSRVENVVKRSQLKQILKEEKILYERKLNYISEYDVLTGIYNRETFFKKVSDLLTEYPGQNFVMGRLDINRFKTINALFGKSKGDNLLIYLAKSLRNVIEKKEFGTYGRLEGDIFVFCFAFKDIKIETAEIVKEIENEISNYKIAFELLPSFGFCEIKDRDVEVDILCDRANLALRTVKGNYVVHYAFYDDSIHEKILIEQEIVSQMKTALEEKQFTIYLQPKYNIVNTQIIGAEALVRWRHPVKGLIPPNDFIPIFERNGFIMKLDAYVWEKTCKLIRKWIEADYEPVPVSVNISRINLYNPQLCDILISLVEKYEISPKLLQLELTESAYTDNPLLLNEIMSRLQGYGFIVMMDDFGSGYSSLNMLKDVPVDVLKIDLKFLEDKKGTMGRGANILSSVVRMAKWLTLPVIIEGVEVKEQVDFLRSIGCTMVQGYYFAKPMPIQDFEASWLQNTADEVVPEDTKIEQKRIDEMWENIMKMALFLGNIIDGYAIYERNGESIEAIRIADNFFEMIEVTREEYYSKVFSVLDWIPKTEEKIKFIEIFDDAANRKDTAGYIYNRKCPNGKIKRIHLRLRYITGDKERQVFLALMNDVTNEI